MLPCSSRGRNANHSGCPTWKATKLAGDLTAFSKEEEELGDRLLDEWKHHYDREHRIIQHRNHEW